MCLGVKVGKKEIPKDIRDCSWTQEAAEEERMGHDQCPEKRISWDSDSLRMALAPLPVPPDSGRVGPRAASLGRAGIWVKGQKILTAGATSLLKHVLSSCQGSHSEERGKRARNRKPKPYFKKTFICLLSLHKKPCSLGSSESTWSGIEEGRDARLIVQR